MKPLLITVSSWEDRFDLGFKKIVEGIADTDVEPLVFTFTDHNYDSKLPHIMRAKAVKDFSDIQLSLDKFSEVWLGIKSHLMDLPSDREIILDVSTMPRHVIWSVLRFLEEAKSREVTCVYHQPEKYDANWITKNPSAPQMVYKLGGEMEINAKTSLLILAGYDEQRIYNLINWYDADEVLLGIHKNDSVFCGRAIDKDKLAETKIQIEQFEYDALAPDFGYKEICDRCRDFFPSERNILLASLGPKSSAIPLYQLNRNKVNSALVYVPSLNYNPDYSKGIGQQYLYKLSFS